ncbi:hypothetical protein R6Q57_009928, partial [Mikania cordata]
MLQVRGESIISPAMKQGMIPLAIPLSKNNLGSVTALLRWPTVPPGMEMPVVEVRSYGVWLLAKTVDQFIHRLLVEEDANGSTESINQMFQASGVAGEKLYTKEDFAKSGNSNLDVYLLQKVGLFPNILERKVANHFKKGDHVSAMVTGEFYTKKEHFPGFGRPFVFNAEVLLKVGRNPEAKDAARGALKSPWWTLGCPYQDVAEIAEWDDEQIEFIKEKVSEQGKQEDLMKGKDAAHVIILLAIVAVLCTKNNGKQYEISEFRAQHDALDLKIIEVTADGNCFFSSLADQLEGDEHMHEKYRKMVKNHEIFEPFIEDEVPFDEYCQSMEKDGIWAGNMELQAASLVTHSNICIHRKSSSRWYIKNFSDFDAQMIH